MNPLEQAVERCAEYGGGPEVTWTVPEEAVIRLAEGDGHLLAGAVITHWSSDE
jgi:hypothetical protein